MTEQQERVAQQQQVQWYYVSQGQRVGPVGEEELRRVVAAGQLYGTDLVWREGMAQWVPVAQVAELVPAGGMPLAYGVASYAPQWGVEYAGFWLRFVAAFIDGLVTGVGGAIIGGIIGGIAGGSGYGPNTPAWGGVSAVIQLLSIVMGWLYSALMESSKTQATLGKMALGLRVTDLEGRRISFGKATGRHFGKIVSWIILAIGFMMAGWTEKKQALHDIMAGTLVVKKGGM
jgi:uncharacterized RDD family membrane protein YckC